MTAARAAALLAAALAAAAAAAVLAGCGSRTAVSDSSLSTPPAAGAPSADPALAASLRETVETLAGRFGPRPGSDPERLRRVAEWIAARLQAARCPARLEPFEAGGRTYWNVLAEVAGTAGPSPGLLIGAHYDTEPGTPGADDNASGVAALLALAERLAHRPAPSRARFAAFALEEVPYFATGDMGSARLAASLRESGDLPAGMLSLEMLGYFSDEPGSQLYPYRFFRWLYPERGDFVAFVGGLGSMAFTGRLHRAFREGTDLPAERLSAPAFVPGVDFSDHRSFAAAGVPAAMITDTAFYRNPHYHAPSDFPHTLDYDRMAQVVLGLEAALRSF